MKRLLFVTICLAFSTLYAGEKKTAALNKIAEHIKNRGKQQWTWVFYGDSITHGAAHTHGWRSFMEIFHERIRSEFLIKKDMVINSGSSGYNTTHLLEENYFNWSISRFNPQVVFLLIGCNDIPIKKLGEVLDFERRLDLLVKKIEKTGAIVILQTYNTIEYCPTKYDYLIRYKKFPEFNQAIRKIAQKHDLILIDHEKHWEKYASSPEVLKKWLGESIHPGAQGHLEMAKIIFQALNIYSPTSRCINVKIANLTPSIIGPQDLIKNNFDDFNLGITPKSKITSMGTWVNSLGKEFSITNGGVNNSKCLKILRDGPAGYGAFILNKAIPLNKNFKISLKFKVNKNQGFVIGLMNNNTSIGGALLIGGTKIRGYNQKKIWENSNLDSVIPTNQWLTCEVIFNKNSKSYTISIIPANGSKIIGKTNHPFLKNLPITEVRFFNILPQKSISLVDDFEISLL